MEPHDDPAHSSPGHAPIIGSESRPITTGNQMLSTIAQRGFLVIAWIILIVAFGILRPDSFLTGATFATILGSQAVLVVLALGLLIPLTVGDFDLSVAGVLTLSAMLVAVLNVNHSIPIGFAICAALVMGAIVGLVNAFFIMFFDIDPIIVTLGIGTFLQGLSLFVSDSQTIGGISTWLTDAVITNRLFGVPLEFYYGLTLCVAIWFVFEFTSLGRRLLFVGSGRTVAHLSGIRVTRVRTGSFVASGTIAALAGVLYAGTSGSADPVSGATFLLPAFAAAFLGATTIVPGRFNAWGTLVAAYFLITGITGLTLLGAGSYVQQLFYGGALVVAVAMSQWVKVRIVKREARSVGAGS